MRRLYYRVKKLYRRACLSGRQVLSFSAKLENFSLFICSLDFFVLFYKEKRKAKENKVKTGKPVKEQACPDCSGFQWPNLRKWSYQNPRPPGFTAPLVGESSSISCGTLIPNFFSTGTTRLSAGGACHSISFLNT